MVGLKCAALRVGIAVMRAIYAVLKLLPTRDEYVFITKLQNTPPVDFTVLADALRRRRPHARITMLCRTMANKPAYVLHMFTQMYHLARARVVFLDRSCLMVHVLHHRESLQVVQLWHAMGSMKAFGFAIEGTPEGQNARVAKVCHMHEGYTHILISSMSFIDDYKAGFHTDGSNVVCIPQPRADLLTDAAYVERKRAEIRRIEPRLADAGKRTLLYAPTFRKHGSSVEEARRAVNDLAAHIDFSKWNLVFSPHPAAKIRIDDERVITVPGMSTFDLLFASDALVSDYSSVIYEAGLLGLPVYLFAYDWDAYHARRTHFIDLEHDLPVLFSGDAAQVAEAACSDRFDYNTFQSFIRRNVVMPEAGTCCDAILDVVGCVPEETEGDRL